MPFKVIKHRTRKFSKSKHTHKIKHLGTRRRHHSSHWGGTTRSRSASPSPARSPSPAHPQSPQYPAVRCEMADPDDIGLFLGSRDYAYTMEGRKDGKIGLVSYYTSCIVGSLNDVNSLDDDFIEDLENGKKVFIRDDWVFDPVELNSARKHRNSVKSWKKQSKKFHERKLARQ